MSFLVAVEAFNLRDIFHFLFDGIDSVGVNTYYRRVMATTPLATLVPRTSLVLTFLASLALVSRTLLVLATRCVNRRVVSGFSFSGVLLLFFCRPVSLEILSIDFTGTGWRLWQCFCLYIDSFFDKLFSRV